MANELRVSSTHGTTVYFQVRSLANQIWNAATPGFEAYSSANIANYAIAATEQGTASGQFVGSFPTGIAAGTYQTEAFQCAGGSPAESDTLVGEGLFGWTGTAAEVPARSSQIPADYQQRNVAVTLPTSPPSGFVTAIAAGVWAALTASFTTTRLGRGRHPRVADQRRPAAHVPALGIRRLGRIGHAPHAHGRDLGRLGRVHGDGHPEFERQRLHLGGRRPQGVVAVRGQRRRAVGDLRQPRERLLHRDGPDQRDRRGRHLRHPVSARCKSRSEPTSA